VTKAGTHREAVVDHLAEVWASLTAACSDLTDAQWGSPTDCPGWTVRDQLSHLIGIERLVMGDESPPPLDVVPEYVHNAFAELNEAWVAARRTIPGRLVLDEFVDVANRRLVQLREMSADEFDVIGWSPVGEVPYREFLDTRVFDSWAHEQDVRRAVGRPGGRNGPGEQSVLDRCASTMPYVVGKKVAPPDGTTVLFAVTGVLGRRLPIVVSGGRATVLGGGEDVTPDVTLTIDQETFWQIGLGRVDPTRSLAAGQVKVDGDTALGNRVLAAMTFMV